MTDKEVFEGDPEKLVTRQCRSTGARGGHVSKSIHTVFGKEIRIEPFRTSTATLAGLIALPLDFA